MSKFTEEIYKYNDKNQVLRVYELWNSLPYQLTKENKKFKYSDAKHKSRASTFEYTIECLKNAGLIYRVSPRNYMQSDSFINIPFIRYSIF